MSAITNVLNLADRAGLLQTAPWQPCDVIWREAGVRLREQFVGIARNILGGADYEEISLPATIPQRTLSIEPRHFRDVARISFKLEDESRGYLRATSESQFASLFYACMQDKIPWHAFQVCTVFRKEQDDRTVPLLRAVEIEPFIETMSFVVNAQSHVRREASLYRRMITALAIPAILVERPQWDTFPEARKSFAFDVGLPDNTVAQIASIHDLASAYCPSQSAGRRCQQNFENVSGGMSGRLLMTALTIHSTQNQLILPSCLSPILVNVTQPVARRYPQAVKVLHSVAPHRIRIGRSNPDTLPAPFQFVIQRDRLICINRNQGQHCEAPIRNLAQWLRGLVESRDSWLTERAWARVGNAILMEPLCTRARCMIDCILDRKGKHILGWSAPSGANTHCRICSKRASRLACFAERVL